MNCMKCGRETVQERVFCEDCLLDMAAHPVKPGTVVLLPRREIAAKKATKKRIVPLEDQVKSLKRWCRLQTFVLVICLVLIAAMIHPTLHYLLDEHVQKGQNYTSIVTPTVPVQTDGSDAP